MEERGGSRSKEKTWRSELEEGQGELNTAVGDNVQLCGPSAASQ